MAGVHEGHRALSDHDGGRDYRAGGLEVAEGFGIAVPEGSGVWRVGCRYSRMAGIYSGGTEGT